MDGNKVFVGEEDMGDGMMACKYHPFKNNPGGICGFCLQEKLGKLVSSSFPLPIHASSSPEIGNDNIARNDGAETSSSTSSLGHSLSAQPSSGKSRKDHHYNEYHSSRARIPFILSKKDQKKKKKKIMVNSNTQDLDFNRNKSITPRIDHFLDGHNGNDCSSPRKKGGFWSFMHLSSKSNISKKIDKCSRETRSIKESGSCLVQPRDDKSIVSSSTLMKNVDNTIMEEDADDSDANASNSTLSLERKVSRSRSVGCGSRRFSSGLGDCSTLRRVESQREGKLPKANMHRAKCGGIFAGFVMTSSSYLISSSSADGELGHGKSNRSWSWALASPMRAFSKPSSKDRKRNANASKNTAPNLAAIPSLLSVRG